MDFLTNINLNKNELQNAVIQNLSVAPSNPKAGQIYFNTGDKLIYQYDGTKWIVVGNEGTVTSVATGAELTGGPITSSGTISHNTSGVTAGTYPKVTVNQYGHVTSGASLAASDIPDLSATYQPKGDYKTTQEAKADPAASGNSTTFIATISQDTNGVITATKKNVQFPDYSNTYLALAGGTMSGNINMNTHSVTGLATPANDADAATKKYVDDAISDVVGGMVFKGTVGSSGTVEWSALPSASASEGFVYKVITDHDTSPVCKVGDLIVSNGGSWVVIPSGDEPSGTVTNIATGSGLTGGPITSSGTISLATAYGDTVNPYASKTKNYVLAAPATANGAPSFRALVASDIPNLSTIYKTVQTAKSDPTASGSALAFIDTISQDTNGVITATKKNINADTTPTEDSSNLVTSGGVYAAIQDVTGGSVHKKTVTNPGLTASGGAWTWLISGSDAMGTSDITITVYKVSSGQVVIPDIAINQSTGAITITINDTAGAGTLTAGTYKAVMMG